MAYFALATIASMSSWLLSIEQTFYIERQPLTLSTAGGAANAAPLLEMEGMGDRVVHRVGDASIDDFGVETFDLVYTSNLVHHLVDEENRDLTRRVARALRPGATTSSSTRSVRAPRRKLARLGPSETCSSR
jgi:SAM-dependent methyltransferase